MTEEGPLTVMYNGQKMAIIDNDGRYDCRHAYIEDVDYEWFQSVDGEKIAIPIEELPPAVLCGFDCNRMKGCYGRCEHYDQMPIVVEDGGTEVGSCEHDVEDL